MARIGRSPHDQTCWTSRSQKISQSPWPLLSCLLLIVLSLQASSSNSKGKARVIQTPIIPSPPTSTIFPTASLLEGMEAQTATLLQALMPVLNTNVNNQVALYQMLARHYGEQENPEDGVDDTDGGSEEGN
jgi:hypothetical protein